MRSTALSSGLYASALVPLIAVNADFLAILSIFVIASKAKRSRLGIAAES